MVKSVSNVSFSSAIGAMDKVSSEQLYNPGLYSMPELMQPPPRPYKERMSFLGFLGRLVLTAGVVFGAPLLARKYLKALSKESVDVTKGLAKEAKPVEKLKYHIAKFGDWVDKNMYQKIVKAFAKKTEEPVIEVPPNKEPNPNPES